MRTSVRQSVRNAADATQVKDARRIEKDEALQAAQDLHAIASTVEGQRFLRRVLGAAGLFESGMGSTDAYTNFRAGRREVALWLVAELTTAAPALVGAILITPEDA